MSEYQAGTNDAITDVPGIRVGHAQTPGGLSGSTVILLPEGAVGSVDVRGPAPGSRETALMAPDKSVTEINAILLTGGSAFGLAAADGVMRYLEEREIGHWTPMARVPIVPASVVYDLFISEGQQRPDADVGYAACENASNESVAQGNVGAGTSVTVGKWGGFEGFMKGGFGTSSVELAFETEDGAATLIAGAAVVTNAVGDVLDSDGEILAGARREDGSWRADQDPFFRFPQDAAPPPGVNTTLAVVASNSSLDKTAAYRLAQRAQDGLAMAIRPVHTIHDGDTTYAVSTGEIEAPYDLVANACVHVLVRAIGNSVRKAASLQGVDGLAG